MAHKNTTFKYSGQSDKFITGPEFQKNYLTDFETTKLVTGKQMPQYTYIYTGYINKSSDCCIQAWTVCFCTVWTGVMGVYQSGQCWGFCLG